MKEKLLISACLCGRNTKYNGKNNIIDCLANLEQEFDLVLVCPEVMGGLSIPRDPSEIKGEMVISSNGKNVTKEYLLGAERALQIAKKNDIKLALLKESSPSCGSQKIYDGTFKNQKIEGEGITTRLLKANHIVVFNEYQVSELFQFKKNLFK